MVQVLDLCKYRTDLTHTIGVVNSFSRGGRAMPTNSETSRRTRSMSVAGPYTRRPTAIVETISRKLARRSELEVVLDGRDDFVRTYSTYDSITGQVEIKFERDTLISDVSVVFEGQSNCFVEKIATASPTTGRTTGKHTFLRMQQPIYDDQLPDHHLALAGTVYRIPFTFVVPEGLLPYVCAHKTENDEVRNQHLLLPPTIGDPLLAGDGNTLMDDLAPEMAKVTYSIKARVKKASPSTGRELDEEEKVVKVRIAPAREEEPPSSIRQDNTSYILRKEKNVRGGVFKIGKKLGRLTAEVKQPRSLRIPHIVKKCMSPVTTMTTIRLRFDPATAQEQPPQLASLATRLKVYTFYGATSYKTLPELSKFDSWSTLHGMYPETVELTSRNMGNVSWTRHESSDIEQSNVRTESDASRRPSTHSAGSTASYSSREDIPDASSTYNSTFPFYTSKVLVPVTLPSNSDGRSAPSRSSVPSLSSTGSSRKLIFVPTFHTCIISRIYALELGLSFVPVNAQGNSSATLTTSSVTLRTPIQISRESGAPSFSPPPQLFAEPTMHDNDEAVARQLDRELNYAHPRQGSQREESGLETPEYQEVQTIMPSRPAYEPRRQSIATMPSRTEVDRPPDYSASSGGPGTQPRRVSTCTQS